MTINEKCIITGDENLCSNTWNSAGFLHKIIYSINLIRKNNICNMKLTWKNTYKSNQINILNSLLVIID